MKRWKEYELALFNELYYVYRPPDFMVEPNFRKVIGLFSEVERQIDVAVFKAEDSSRPYIAVECKHYTKEKLDVKDVETFIGMRNDLGAEHAILVCPLGFSKGALRRAEAANIHTFQRTDEDMKRLNLREYARITLPWDESLHPAMGDALFELNSSPEFDNWVGELEQFPFEEWEATLISFREINVEKCRQLLRMIAHQHWDDAWRFNAVRLLDEFNWLDEITREFLLEGETDPEVKGILQNSY